MTLQSSLLTVLPQGVWLLRGFLTRAEQERLRDELRAVAREAPFFSPSAAFDPAPARVQITNAGEFGYLQDERGRRYSRRSPRHGRPWPPIPEGLLDAGRRAAGEAGFRDYRPNACQINFYQPLEGSYPLHRDDTRGEDTSVPCVTVSLGDTAVLGVGGPDKKDELRHVEVGSGDVLVLGGPGRSLYHEIRSVASGCDLLSRGGRISATLRGVMFESRFGSR